MEWDATPSGEYSSATTKKLYLLYATKLNSPIVAVNISFHDVGL